MHEPDDDLYLYIMLGCAHKQKANGQEWVQLIGVANESAVFVMFVGLAKGFEA